MIVTIRVKIDSRTSQVGIERSGDDFVVSIDGSVLENSRTFDAALERAGRKLREVLSPAQGNGARWGLMVTACDVTVRPFGDVDFGFAVGGGGGPQ
jgi:hypothetical protein